MDKPRTTLLRGWAGLLGRSARRALHRAQRIAQPVVDARRVGAQGFLHMADVGQQTVARQGQITGFDRLDDGLVLLARLAGFVA